eukprot:NODE_17_length_41373_cov_0.337016.p21 type:complete len:205 gc:universal NODE_17_length_41373_cov_0.337016:22980-23594(+)
MTNRLQTINRIKRKEYKGRPFICWIALCVCSSMLITLVVFIVMVVTFTLPTLNLNDFSSGNPPYSIQGGTFLGNSINGNLQDVVVRMNWNLNLQVVNPNFYGFTVDNLSIDIYYRNNNVLVSQVQNTRVQIAPKDTTNQTIPISVILKMTGSQASTYMEIMSKCGYLGGAKSTLGMRYEIKIDTAPINWFVKPVFKINYDNSIY